MSMDADNRCHGGVCCLAPDEQAQTLDIRLDKVLTIRCQLDSGAYPLVDYLDEAADRLLEHLCTSK
ncbi:MAG: hypothetical protein HQ515_06025 [Phycisphaeraceae bacterium]|nr:hypothetical protein [Phycisphaeraceae bacterium]